MKQYMKDGQIKSANCIVANKDGFNIYNPTEQLISLAYVYYSAYY